MKQKFHFNFLLLIIRIIHNSCATTYTNGNMNVKPLKNKLNKHTATAEIEKKTIKRKNIKGKIISNGKSGECGKLIVESWEFDHFESEEGKMVGIWPYEGPCGDYYSVSNLNIFRTKWGYIGLF